MKSYRLRERLHENLLDHLLLSRGVAAEDHANFLNPDYERDSGDPMLLPDMAAAVERLAHAKKAGELVCVWSDYDTDGTTGGVMLTQFLRAWGLKVIHYIPHRHREGYGLNTHGIDELKGQGVALIITVDLGTTEHEHIAYAKKLRIDTIVTDHHLVDTLPPALATINPKRPDSRYPFDGLCGAGVAWKLVQALLKHERPSNYGEGQEKWLLDLVGVGTLADMVPLRGENRMLARNGLLVLRRARRPGPAALFKLMRVAQHTLTEDDITFMLSPRLNAASRMDTPHTAAALLGAEEPLRALELAQQLDAINNERKVLVALTVKEANKHLREQGEMPVIVMGNPRWRPGILGLVAQKLLEAHQKPVFLWGREGGEVLRGSCRSQGVSVVELMAQAGDVLSHFGGHAASGGFSVVDGRAHELPARLIAAYEKLQAAAPLAEVVALDREMSLAELGAAHKEVQKLSPFGMGFAKPLFLFPKVSLTGARVFGKQRNHLELALEQGGARSAGVAFFAGTDSFTKSAAPGERADVVGHIELDWRGSPRLRVVDIL